MTAEPTPDSKRQLVFERASDPRARRTVCVLLATCNGSRYLAEQLETLASQTEDDWHLVVADDGSTDSTADILRTFSDDHPGRVSVLDLPPVKSASGNFFRLLGSVDAEQYEYFAFCDQDDRWHPHKLRRLIEVCRSIEGENSPTDPCLVGSDLRVVDAQLEVVATSFMKEIRSEGSRITLASALVENYVPGCAMLMNAATVSRYQEYGQLPKHALMHDWWILLIALSMGHFVHMPERLVDYRQHGENAAGSVQRHGLGFIVRKMISSDHELTAKLARQSQEFADAYRAELSPDNLRTLELFGQIVNLPKVHRVRRCVELGSLKQTIPRRIYQMLRV